jgi:hypothetical protein
MMRMALTCATLLLLAAPARADLTGFMSNLNAKASVDLPGFQASISAQFNVPLPQVQATVQQVAKPADAFMVYQVAQYAAKPPATALQVYQANKTKGWGAIAQEMGIKPGSPEFHKLKNGDLTFGGKGGAAAPAGNAPAADPGPGKGKGKGKGNN